MMAENTDARQVATRLAEEVWAEQRRSAPMRWQMLHPETQEILVAAVLKGMAAAKAEADGG